MSSSPFASMSRMEQQMEKQLAAALEKLTAKSEVIIHRYARWVGIWPSHDQIHLVAFQPVPYLSF
jgi:hypothetical protein